MLDVTIQSSYSSFHLDITFQAQPGITGILGPSGCGKTMTLQSLAGIIKPENGKISMDKQTWFDKSDRTFWKPQKRKVGYLFQNYALFPHLTVEQNIAFGLKGLPKHEIEKKVKRWLGIIQLEGFKNRYPSKLSGGQQQRVALARSMITEPQLLLLDEPFSALDQHIRHSLEEDLKHLIDDTFRGVVLLVTHNIEEAYRMCDSIMLFNDGKVIQQGNRKQILQYPRSKKAAEIVGCENVVPIVGARKKVEGTEILIGKSSDTLICETIEGSDFPPTYLGIHNHHLSVSKEKIKDDNVKSATVIKVIEGITRRTIIAEYAGFHWRVDHNEQSRYDKEIYKEGDSCYLLFPEEKLILMNG
ncbi:sulfate/molybdate ABC transporter ATP-binding protein [Salipaludibacillus daqingensis]|uniref:sulfate/molybdate ABC transporter ATP-binding protein n=1 Tax=Salipaludibacillus daqingensis TaxID=3041001 RepID=UPI002473EAEB|nr:ABC transporter ATP-binding protein [Salipaludibacillus daqingensis]